MNLTQLTSHLFLENLKYHSPSFLHSNLTIACRLIALKGSKTDSDWSSLRLLWKCSCCDKRSLHYKFTTKIRLTSTDLNNPVNRTETSLCSQNFFLAKLFDHTPYTHRIQSLFLEIFLKWTHWKYNTLNITLWEALRSSSI